MSLERDRQHSADAEFLESDEVRPLPPFAREVDLKLALMDGELEWLSALSPLGGDAMFQEFERSGYREEPHLRYPRMTLDVARLRSELDSLPVSSVEHPLLRALFAEKRQEISLLIQLIELRETSGVTATSLALFGDATPALLEIAHQILAEVPVETNREAKVGCSEVMRRAREMLELYRSEAPDFPCDVILNRDMSSLMMVENGRLHIALGLEVPESRVEPLLAHEIGTHIVTHYNGFRQSIGLLGAGLSGYDELQEGLATFSEYLTGCLPPGRLRVLAARVVAAKHAVLGTTTQQIFAELYEEHEIPPHEAFDVAVRARRGGGLTKDVVYLKGLHELLSYLKSGGEISKLFCGKFALSQLPLLSELEGEGWVKPARVLPHFLRDQRVAARLKEALSSNVRDLFQTGLSI